MKYFQRICLFVATIRYQENVTLTVITIQRTEEIANWDKLLMLKSNTT